MLGKIILGTVILGVALPAPALADPPKWAPAHGRRAHERAEARERHDAHDRYAEPVLLTKSDRIWKGDDGRYHCRRANGTTGLVIGAAVGAVAGHEIAGDGDRTLGTILGAAGGALIGKALDKGELHCR